MSVGLGHGGAGLAVAAAAWFGADGMAGQLLKGRERQDPWQMGRRLGRVSLVVAVGIVLVWSLAGLAVYRARA